MCFDVRLCVLFTLIFNIPDCFCFNIYKSKPSLDYKVLYHVWLNFVLFFLVFCSTDKSLISNWGKIFKEKNKTNEKDTF